MVAEERVPHGRLKKYWGHLGTVSGHPLNPVLVSGRADFSVAFNASQWPAQVHGEATTAPLDG